MGTKPLHHLQETLRKKGLERLTGHYKVKVNIHPKYRNLHMFKYNQIDSPMGSKVVQACRGIILDADNDWAPVCHTYNKFFNLQEGHAAEIDWDTAKVYEKLDGSLMQLYYYDNQWHVATSGTPDADCSVPFGNMTFKDLFWQTWDELGYEFPMQPSRHLYDPVAYFCFAFELMTKYNYVVVRHEKPRLVLHGCRNLINDIQNKVIYSHEVDPTWLGTWNKWEIVKQFDFGYDDATAALLKMDGGNQEGFVIVDGSKNRVKMKCEDYVKKHRLVSSLSQRNMLDLVRTNEGTEFLAYFPEWKDVYDEIKEKYDALTAEVDQDYKKLKGITNQKDYAFRVKKLKVPAALFNIRSGKAESARDYLSKMNIRHLENLLELKNEV